MQRTVTYDDLDGTSIADETIRFSLDDDFRTIDLSAENAQGFYKLLEPYLNASQPWSPTKAAPKPSMTKDERAAIKAWAEANGQTVSDRGRIPNEIVEAYKQSLTSALSNKPVEKHATVEQIEQAIAAGEATKTPAEEPVEAPVEEPTSSSTSRRRK